MTVISRPIRGFVLVFFVGVLFLGGGLAFADPYLTADEVPLTILLPPPPTVGSAEQQSDLAAVLDAQNARTPESTQRAIEDSTRSVMRFSEALGLEAASRDIPQTKVLFREIAHEAEDLTDSAKQVFHRTRPFVDDSGVKPLIVTPADGSRPTGQTPSYPSGHSTFGWAAGILLAQMVPERSGAIFARAAEFAHNRLVAGVHYPSDVEAGRVCGTVIANALWHSARFRADFDAAKVELRRALGLP